MASSSLPSPPPWPRTSADGEIDAQVLNGQGVPRAVLPGDLDGGFLLDDDAGGACIKDVTRQVFVFGELGEVTGRRNARLLRSSASFWSAVSKEACSSKRSMTRAGGAHRRSGLLVDVRLDLRDAPDSSGVKLTWTPRLQAAPCTGRSARHRLRRTRSKSSTESASSSTRMGSRP